jgi:lysophospholipase L1-like esterase
MTAFGDFTVTIDPTKQGGNPEDAATLQIRLWGPNGTLIDVGGAKVITPHPYATKKSGLKITEPLNITLKTDVPADADEGSVSETIGYVVEFGTARGGTRTATFWARRAGTSVDFTEVVDQVELTPVPEGQRNVAAWLVDVASPVHAALLEVLDGLELGGGGASSWDQLEGVPDEFPPAEHVHVITDVTGLPAALDAKADDADLAAEAAARAAADALALPKAGGTMTGALVLSQDPTNAMHAATKQFVLAQVAGLVGAAPEELDTFAEVLARFLSDESVQASIMATLAGKQPLDDDLTAIASLGTTAFGRDFLTLVDAAAARLKLGLGSAATHAHGDYLASDRTLAGLGLSGNITAADLVTALATSLNGAYGRVWQASTAYSTGDIVRAPDGSIIQRIAGATSRPAYDATEAALWTTLVATKTASDAVYASRRAELRQAAALPLPPVASRTLWHYAASPNSDPRNSKIRHTLTQAVTELRFVYVNQYGSEAMAATASPITIEAGLELTSGTVYPVLFNGARAVTVYPSGIAISDPVTVQLAAGTVFYSRTFVSGATGVYPVGATGLYIWPSDNNDASETGPSVTSKALSGTPAANVATYGPAAIIGRNGGDPLPQSYVGVGDSILYGQGDTQGLTNAGQGFLARALGGTRAFLNLAMSGESAGNFATLASSRTRRTLTQGATRAVVNYGRNDLEGGATGAVLAASLISVWTTLSARGIKVWQATITPKSTSTDSWSTLTNQTPAANETHRATINAWLRDGAPILAGAYALAGSSAPGTLRAGATGHPLSGVHDVAAVVEASGGKWAVPETRTITGMARDANTARFNADAGSFSAADVGKLLIVPGAGTSGATYFGYISSFISATQVQMTGAIPTAVTGVTGTIAAATTGDGTHPIFVGATLMAAAVNVAAMDA